MCFFLKDKNQTLQQTDKLCDRFQRFKTRVGHNFPARGSTTAPAASTRETARRGRGKAAKHATSVDGRSKRAGAQRWQRAQERRDRREERHTSHRPSAPRSHPVLRAQPPAPRAQPAPEEAPQHLGRAFRAAHPKLPPRSGSTAGKSHHLEYL